MKSKNIAGVFVILFTLSVKAQTIFYEGFEGPLSNWYNQGTLIGFDNNITPYAGAGMLKLGNNQTAETSTFILPTGAKYISFYRTSPVQPKLCIRRRSISRTNCISWVYPACCR